MIKLIHRYIRNRFLTGKTVFLFKKILTDFRKNLKVLSFWKILQLIFAIPVTILASAIIIIFLTLPNVNHLKTTCPKHTAMMTQRMAEAEAKKKPFKIRQQWVSFKDIPLLLKHTVRISEDDAFYQHEGIDFNELVISIKRNWKEKKYARGASTITQQLAKNLFLSTRKTVFRKIKEYFIAKRLESVLSKDRIFELYLNIIELGHGVFGVQKASEIYFNKDVSRLNLGEILRLVAIIPKPLRVNPNGSSGYLKWRVRLLLPRLLFYHYIDQETHDTILPQFQKNP